MADQTEDSKSRLLDLAAELRNRIYAYAVCSDRDTSNQVRISTSNYAQPGLLATCKQIRYEAAPICYLENKFGFDLPLFNPSLLIAFTRQARACVGARRFKCMVYCYTPGQPRPARWANVLHWLRSFHDDEVEDCEVDYDDGWNGDKPFYVVTQAFRLVSDLKGKVAWANIESVLGHWKASTKSIMQWQD